MLIGQNKILSIIDKLIKSRQDTYFPNILLSGPAGFGKTSIVKYIGDKLERKKLVVNGATVKGINDIAKCLFAVGNHEILFIDEVHRLNINSQECLYPVFDDYVFFLFQDNSPEPVVIDLPKFSIICATTNLGKLSAPFLSRFAHIFELEDYTNNDIAKIIRLSSKIDIDALYLATYARGIPRLAKMLTEWINDYCIAINRDSANKEVIDAALKEKGIYKYGLTQNDMKYIKILTENIGRPVGIKTISSSLNIDELTIQEVIEPFLLSRKIIFKTSKGRIINNKYLKEFMSI